MNYPNNYTLPEIQRDRKMIYRTLVVLYISKMYKGILNILL